MSAHLVRCVRTISVHDIMQDGSHLVDRITKFHHHPQWLKDMRPPLVVGNAGLDELAPR
jgi:hypothetical protein